MSVAVVTYRIYGICLPHARDFESKEKPVPLHPNLKIEDNSLGTTKNLDKMKKKQFLLAGVLAVAPIIAASAQNVRGTIVDATTGESIVGATIRYGDGKGVLTDYDGHFAIDVKSLPVKLSITYTGYHPQTITVYDDEEDIDNDTEEKDN